MLIKLQTLMKHLQQKEQIEAAKHETECTAKLSKENFLSIFPKMQKERVETSL